MALHPVDLRDLRPYSAVMVEEFMLSDIEAAEVDVPDTYKNAASFRNSLIRHVMKRGYKDKVDVAERSGKIYLIRK